MGDQDDDIVEEVSDQPEVFPELPDPTTTRGPLPPNYRPAPQDEVWLFDEYPEAPGLVRIAIYDKGGCSIHFLPANAAVGIGQHMVRVAAQAQARLAPQADLIVAQRPGLALPGSPEFNARPS